MQQRNDRAYQVALRQARGLVDESGMVLVFDFAEGHFTAADVETAARLVARGGGTLEDWWLTDKGQFQTEMLPRDDWQCKDRPKRRHKTHGLD